MKFINLIIYYYLFILLLICNSFVNGQFTRISEPGNLKVTVLKDAIYSTYPLKSNDNSCSFQIWLQVTTDNINDSPNTLISLGEPNGVISNPYPADNIYTTYPFETVLVSGTSLVYNLKAESTLLEIAEYQVNFTCLAFNYDEIKVGFLDDAALLAYLYFSPFKIYGLGGHVFSSLKYNDSIGSVSISKSLNCYYFQWSVDYIKLNLLSNWTTTITIGNQAYTFTTRSYYYQDLPTTLLSQTVIPSNIVNSSQVFTEFGFGYTPVFQSIYNSEYVSPFDFYSDAYYTLPSVPIKGVKGNMIYQQCFYSFQFDGVSSITLPVLSQNNSNIISTTYSMIVKKYMAPIISSTILINYISSPSNSLFAAEFTSTDYNFQEFAFYLSPLVIIKSFPFGFKSGTNIQYIHKIVFSRALQMRQSTSEYVIGTVAMGDRVAVQLNVDPLAAQIIPIVYSYEIFKLVGIYDLVRINIVTSVGLQYITYGYQTSTAMEILVDGTIYNGTYEFFFLPFDEKQLAFSFTDLNGYSKNQFIGDFFLTSPAPLVFKLPSYYKYTLDMSDFINITFSDNDLNLLNQTGYTIMELKSSTIPIDLGMSVLIMDTISFDIGSTGSTYKSTLPLVYNASSNSWKCKIVIPKNNIFGEIPFIIIHPIDGSVFSKSLPLSARLRVSNTYLDNQGPLFSSINLISTPNTGNIGWLFTITDDWNGFESGYIKVMGSIDGSKYEFNFTSADRISGTIHNGDYNIIFYIDSSNCFTQNYTIIYIELYDTNQVKSVYNQFGYKESRNKSPFINFYQVPLGMDLLKNQFICTPSILDISQPILTSFEYYYSVSKSPASIDVGLVDRVISFDFEIQLGTSGIKDKQFPVVYIITKTMISHECISNIVSNNATHVSLNCSTELPIAFGYSGELIFSIYGFINNGGNFYGWSTDDIISLGFTAFTETTLSVNVPVITSTNNYYSDGGTLIIYGRGFLNTLNVLVKTNLNSSTFDIQLVPTKIYGSVLIIENLFPISTTFKIAVSTNNELQSNEFIVNPIYFSSTNPTNSPIPTSSVTPTNSPIPTSSVIPTNPPKRCLGTPTCGGENQGYCSSSGCICLSPWVGLDCTSQIIIVPQPIINNTDPTTSIPIGGSNTSSSENGKENIFFKSLISIVSLRELNFKNQEVNNYIFDQWIYTPLSDTRNQYFTRIKGSKTSDKMTNITVVLEWFNQSSTVIFANQNLTMNPSSIKYTIEIGEYPFSSQLNQLQLVMSAEFQSNKINDVCLINEFGDTTSGDNSNYLKIQIENHSLYGRFIKRAIIDGKVASIDNILLDSTYNEINDQQSKSQTFIGITIPFYNKLILIDPDFSVLIDSNNASGDKNSPTSNSICSGNGKSGLTSSQLAGIIIGSVAFATVISVAVIYSYKKTKSQKKFLKGMNKKMDNLNK